MHQRTLIIAQDHEGHRLVYVRLLTQALLERGASPVLALNKRGLDSDEFQLNLKNLENSYELVALASPVLTVKSVARLAKRTNCGRVLVPDGDRFAIRLGATVTRYDLDIVALVMQDPHWCIPANRFHMFKLWLKAAVLRLAERRPQTRILYLGDHFQQPTRSGQLMAPDPVLFDAAELSPLEIRTELGLDTEKFWFVVAGKITPRKNLTLVSSALLELDRSDVGLFVCGAIDPTVRSEVDPIFKRLAGRGISTIVDDRVQTEHEMNRAVQASDCVVVAYSSDQPTSMMAKSVRAGRRTIVAGGPSLTNWAKNLGIRLTGPLSEPELTRLLREALQTPMPEPRKDLGHQRFIDAFL